MKKMIMRLVTLMLVASLAVGVFATTALAGNGNTQIHLHGASDATTVVVKFNDGRTIELQKTGDVWKGKDNKEYVASQIVDILIDGQSSIAEFGVEGNGGTLNIWENGTQPSVSPSIVPSVIPSTEPSVIPSVAPSQAPEESPEIPLNPPQEIDGVPLVPAEEEIPLGAPTTGDGISMLSVYSFALAGLCAVALIILRRKGFDK